MKKIEIQLLLQDDTSKDCGPICCQMILNYFGIKNDLNEIKEKLDYREEGTSAYDNGSILLREGLKVKAITAHPFFFSPDLIKQIHSNQDIIEIIEKRAQKFPKEEPGINTIKTFLNDGGKMLLEIPEYIHIKEAIDNSSPLIALIYAKALGSHEGGFHFVIINGYDNDQIFITNPSPLSKKQAWFPIKDFLYSLHSSTTRDVDNGTILVVSK